MALDDVSGSARVAEALRDLRAKSATGVLYVVSDDNRQARIGIVGGEVESILLRGVEERDVLNVLAHMNVVRTRFGPNEPRPHPSTLLPDTAGVIRALLQPGAGGAPSAPPAATASASSPDAAPSAAPAAVTLSPVAHQEIRRILTDYLGPIAGIVHDEHRDAGLDGDALLHKLAGEIPDAGQAGEFLARVRESLRRT